MPVRERVAGIIGPAVYGKIIGPQEEVNCVGGPPKNAQVLSVHQDAASGARGSSAAQLDARGGTQTLIVFIMDSNKGSEPRVKEDSSSVTTQNGQPQGWFQWFFNYFFTPVLRGVFYGMGSLMGCVLVRALVLQRTGIFKYSGPLPTR